MNEKAVNSYLTLSVWKLVQNAQFTTDELDNFQVASRFVCGLANHTSQFVSLALALAVRLKI